MSLLCDPIIYNNRLPHMPCTSGLILSPILPFLNLWYSGDTLAPEDQPLTVAATPDRLAVLQLLTNILLWQNRA